MKPFKRALSITFLALWIVNAAHADVLITVKQVGDDVVAELSGDLDLSNEPAPSTFTPNLSVAAEGTANGGLDIIAVGGPESGQLTGWGSTNFSAVPTEKFITNTFSNYEMADTSSGDYFYISGKQTGGRLIVGTGLSGQIAGSSTWEDQDYQSLGGLVSGTYVWTTQGGETITLEIEEPPPPTTVSTVLDINIKQVGSDVVVTVTGNLDLRAESASESTSHSLGVTSPGFSPGFGGFVLGEIGSSSLRSRFSVFATTPTDQIFSGNAANLPASSSSGAFFGMAAPGGNYYLFYSEGFTNGSLNSTTTWEDTTLSNLTLIPGTYTWETTGGATISMTIEPPPADPDKVAELVAFDGSQPAPTLATYEAASIAGVIGANVAAYNSALSALDTADAAEVQAMVDAYNAFLAGAGDNTLAAALTASQYEALGLTLTTNASAQTVADLLNIAIANLDSGADIDTFEKLQAVVVRINNLVDFANGTTSVNEPVLSDYALLGMTGLAEANLDSYNSAVFTKGAITGTAIQAAISAYNAVLAGAGQGQSATVTSQQYEDIAVTVTVIPTEVPLAGEVLSIVNSAVGTQAKEASDTVTELRRMAKGANTIIQTATDSSDAGLVEEDFSVLGIVGVRAGNLPDVVTAVEGATASELTSVPAIKAELPSLSDPVSVAALAGFDGEGDAPNKAVYESAGVAGIDEDNVASYNSALATLTIAEDDLDAIQDVVDAYNAILSAVGTTNTSTLGVDDFEALGLSVSAASLPLLREAISDLEAADINAIAELSAVVGSATKLAGQADEAVTNEAPGAADYTAVGVSSVVAANVSAYNSAVEASGASTSSALQSVVTTINAIAAAANGNPATVPSLAVTDYAAIGVTVPGPSLGLVNSSVGSQGASASNTSTKLSAIVTAVNKILATVGTSGQSSGLTVADFAALGVEGVTDTNLDDAIVAIAAAGASDVQTLSAIEALLSDVLITPLPVPTLSQWVLILLAALLLMVSAPVLRRS